MNRLARVLLVGLALVGVGRGRPARAQVASGGALPTSTPLPLAADLKKAKVGTWAEYQLSDGQTSMKVRMALVGRGRDGADIETRISGGPMGALGAATMGMTLAVGAKEAKPTHHMMQLGSNDPMLLPDLGANGQVLKRPDPKARVGVESLTVPAGVFPRAEHYREVGPNGQTIEFWVSPDVAPFGVLKVASQLSGQPQTMELVARGGGAKRVITKTAKPYDQAALMRMLQAGMASSGGNGTSGGTTAVPPTNPAAASGPGAGGPAHPAKGAGVGAPATEAGGGGSRAGAASAGSGDSKAKSAGK